MVEQIKAEIKRLELQRTDLETEGKKIIETCTGTRFMNFDLQDIISNYYSEKLKNINNQLGLLRNNLTSLEVQRNVS